MNAARLWTLGSIIVIIALVAGTWFVGISPRLAEAAKANTERESVEILNQKHAATVAALKKQFEELPALKADLDTLRIAVPSSDDSASLYRQLHALAKSAGVTITDLTLSPPERFVAPAEPPADPELAAALGSVSPENFLVIPVEQTIDGSYSSILKYVTALQLGKRTFLVHDLTLGGGLPAGGSEVTVKLSGQIFVLLEGVVSTPEEGVVTPTEGGAVAE